MMHRRHLDLMIYLFDNAVIGDRDKFVTVHCNKNVINT